VLPPPRHAYRRQARLPRLTAGEGMSAAPHRLSRGDGGTATLRSSRAEGESTRDLPLWPSAISPAPAGEKKKGIASPGVSRSLRKPPPPALPR